MRLFTLSACGSFSPLDDVEIDRIALFQRLISLDFDRTEVTEHIGPCVAAQKAVALCIVEPLHGTLEFRHHILLRSTAKFAGSAKQPSWSRSGSCGLRNWSVPEPDHVIEDLKEVAPSLGFGGYQALIRALHLEWSPQAPGREGSATGQGQHGGGVEPPTHGLWRSRKGHPGCRG